jgi:radical SAM superfamily enzyme YgiQ (UPF0313 family)
MTAKKSDLDLVLVNPASRKKVYQGLGQELAAIEPPVWAGLMATFVRRKGLRVAILDAEAEELSAPETAERVRDMNPLLTAVVVFGHQPSASTQIMPAAGAVCTALKQVAPELKILMLGGHVAALPERTLNEEDCDFVSRGEGLHTLIDLVEALKGTDPDLGQVRDLGYRDDEGNVQFGKPAPLVLELDREMPGMAWDLLPMAKYRAHNWHCLGHLQRSPYAAIYTTLGCPYKCSFCCIQAPFKPGEAELGYKATTNSYRFWSPKTVVDQLELLVKEYGVFNVKFADEMFVLNRKHVETICDLIIARGLKLNIWAYARVDTIKDGMLDKLKRAGFNWLALGIEAANEKVRVDVQKGFDQDDIFSTLKKIGEAGIYVIGNFIFGLPEDDHDTMKQTLDLAMALNCEFANFYSTMAYPGSALYELALARNWKLPETWGGYSQHSPDTLPLPTNYLSSAEVLRFRDQAFQTYFTNPRFLQMVEQKFGAPTRVHIEHMTAVPLVRKFVS